MKARIVGHAMWGGGVFIHVVYHIEVYHLNATWFVYRRYSQFESFHRSLLGASSEEHLTSLSLELPKKEKSGTYGSTLKYVITKRLAALETYLRALNEFEGADQLPCVAAFFDFENKGLSGCLGRSYTTV
jgi:PX domain